MVKSKALACAAALVVSACSTYEMIGLGVVDQSVSEFDGSTHVSASPNFLARSNGATLPVYLGARWNSAHPEYAQIDMQYRSDISGGMDAYVSIDGLSVSVDGSMYDFEAQAITDLDSSTYNQVSNTIYTQSTNYVSVPLELLREMVDADQCGLRIHTSEGYFEALFHVDELGWGTPSAKHSIRRMLTLVDAAIARASY